MTFHIMDFMNSANFLKPLLIGVGAAITATVAIAGAVACNSLPDTSQLSQVPSRDTSQTSEIPLIKEERAGAQQALGTYRCWSYNVSGGGGSCRLAPPIILKSDRTYEMSSEKGTYTIEGDTITLSESKIRGPGKVLEGGMQIRFEYNYNQLRHTVTYLKDENVAEPKEGVDYVEVTLSIVFPPGECSADFVNAATLMSKGDGEPAGQTLAYAQDECTTQAWFSKRHPKIGVPTGSVYDVRVSSGFDEWKVGELDLRGITDNVEQTIHVEPARVASGESEPLDDEAQDPSPGPEIVYVSVELTLQYGPGDDALHNVTRIKLVPQGDTYGPEGIAGYGTGQQLVGSFSVVEAGLLYNVYTSSYYTGQVKVGALDLRSATGNIAETIFVE